jgi:CBS domain-containing protein
MALADAAESMHEHGVGCLPVVDAGRLVGVVTATDVLDEIGRESAAVSRRSRPRILAARARRRRHDTARRAPFAALQPRPVKRRAGRTAGPDVPAHVRVLGTKLGQTDRDYIRRKLGMKLGKFAEAIERVSVRVEDVNGPRGGIDQVCRVKVVLSGMPSVVYEARNAALHAAIDRALSGTERSVRRALGRRRTKPVTRSTRPSPRPVA